MASENVIYSTMSHVFAPYDRAMLDARTLCGPELLMSLLCSSYEFS